MFRLGAARVAAANGISRAHDDVEDETSFV
jgi:hypothetical protein